MASNSKLIVIWLDRSIGKEGEFLELKEHFRTVSSAISQWIYIDNDDDFDASLIKYSHERIILITSGSAAKRKLGLFSLETNIHSVYIFCVNEAKYRTMENEEHKIRGIFNSEHKLFDALKRDLDQEFPTTSDLLLTMSDTAAIANL